MPTAHLIFFAEPRELTDAEYEEARSLGHLRPAAAPPSAGVRYPVTEMTQQGITTVDPPEVPEVPLPDVPDEPAASTPPAAKPKTRRKES